MLLRDLERVSFRRHPRETSGKTSSPSPFLAGKSSAARWNISLAVASLGAENVKAV